jgi:hypothetical protein
MFVSCFKYEQKGRTNDRLINIAGGGIWSKRIIYRKGRQFRNQRKRWQLKAVD